MVCIDSIETAIEFIEIEACRLKRKRPDHHLLKHLEFDKGKITGLVGLNYSSIKDNKATFENYIQELRQENSALLYC